MKCLSIVLEHEAAFQLQDRICLFLEQLAFKAYRSEITPSDSPWNWLETYTHQWGIHFINPLFMRSASYTMSSLQQKHSSQVYITWPEIKIIKWSVLSKEAHSFTHCTEMPGISRFYIGFFFFFIVTMNILGKLLDIWGGTELYPPLVPTSGYKSWNLISIFCCNLKFAVVAHSCTNRRRLVIQEQRCVAWLWSSVAWW